MENTDRILTTNGQNKRFSKELLNLVTEFLACEIGGKAVDGITYAMLLKNNEADMKSYEIYMKIKDKAKELGFSNDEVLRVYEVKNGYIFDMDLGTSKEIILQMIKAVSKAKNKPYAGDLIGDSPEKRRKHDMLALAKLIKAEVSKGNTSVTVALFSRNTTDKITVTAKDQTGKKVAIVYKAYAIRHWDIETLNAQVLIPNGLKIKSMQPCEILPYKTGVSFILNIEQLY